MFKRVACAVFGALWVAAQPAGAVVAIDASFSNIQYTAIDLDTSDGRRAWFRFGEQAKSQISAGVTTPGGEDYETIRATGWWPTGTASGDTPKGSATATRSDTALEMSTRLTDGSSFIYTDARLMGDSAGEWLYIAPQTTVRLTGWLQAAVSVREGTDCDQNWCEWGAMSLHILAGATHAVQLINLHAEGAPVGPLDQMVTLDIVNASDEIMKTKFNVTMQSSGFAFLVPEPPIAALFGIGLAGLAGWRRVVQARSRG